jgi:short-subunit dehydrogenase
MQHVIVTGGSSGIGAAIAATYSARGAKVTLIARSRARLDATASQLRQRHARSGGDVFFEVADVCDAARLSGVVVQAERRFGPCDVLVTSAGIVQPASFSTLSPAEFDAQIGVNVTGTANAVRAVYPGMEHRGSGAILMISSGAALIGIYGYSAYCASKYAVHGFAEALRVEAKAAGIRVAVCFPPDTDTPQLAAERLLRPPEAAAVIGRAGLWSADRIAETAVQKFEAGHFMICPGLRLRLLARFGSLAMPVLRMWSDRKVATTRSRLMKEGGRTNSPPDGVSSIRQMPASPARRSRQ